MLNKDTAQEKRPSRRYRLMLILLFTCLMTGLLYFRLGAMQQLSDWRAVSTVNETFSSLLKQPNLSLSDIETTFNRLSVQYRRSAPALARLGELSLQLGWYEKSRAVFEQAYERDPSKTTYQVQAFYAESLLHQGKLSAESLAKAIALNAAFAQQEAIDASDPAPFTLMNILAIDAYFTKDYVKAIQHWQSILMADESLSSDRRAVLENAIEKCRAYLAEQSTTRFRVVVKLSPALQAELKPQDTIFIAVKAVALDMPPLYVMKCKASELPKELILDDSTAMIEAPNFDRIHSVEVIAKLNQTHRVSSGKIIPQKGDNRVSLWLTGEKDV